MELYTNTSYTYTDSKSRIDRMKKRFQIFIILILFVISTIIGCIVTNENDEESKSNDKDGNDIELKYWYNISIGNVNVNDILYLPLILDYSSNISKVNDEIEITGGKLDTISTDFGKALKLECEKQTIIITMTGHDISKTEKDKIDFPHFLYLSLYLDENNNSNFDFEDTFDYKIEYNIYYNGSSNNPLLDLDFGYDWVGGPTYGGFERVKIENAKINDNWNIYNANYGEGHN
jgi:hypothetical protein